MEKKWIDGNNNFWNGNTIVIDGIMIWNPSEEQLIEAGYTEYIEPEPTPVELLERAKKQKLSEIEEFDNSNGVNGFSVVIPTEVPYENITLTTWINRETRADYKNSLDAAELLGRTEVTPIFNGTPITLQVTMAKMALAQIQIYANQCYNVTQQHKATIEALDNIEDVEAFNIYEGYPQKLVFELPGVQYRDEEEIEGEPEEENEIINEVTGTSESTGIEEEINESTGINENTGIINEK